MLQAQLNNEETLNEAKGGSIYVARDDVADYLQKQQQEEVNSKKAHPGFKEDATNMFADMFGQSSKLKPSLHKNYPKYLAMNSEN